MAALALTQVRAAAAAALAPRTETDPPVLPDLVDAVTPPAIMLEWNDPWLTVQTVAGGIGILNATLNVICFAGRVEPGPGVNTLEQLVSLVLARLGADAYTWNLTASQAPRRFDINGIPLLGVRQSFTVPVSVAEPAPPQPQPPTATTITGVAPDTAAADSTSLAVTLTGTFLPNNGYQVGLPGGSGYNGFLWSDNTSIISDDWVTLDATFTVTGVTAGAGGIVAVYDTNGQTDGDPTATFTWT
jgi:hypothetical protein